MVQIVVLILLFAGTLFAESRRSDVGPIQPPIVLPPRTDHDVGPIQPPIIHRRRDRYREPEKERCSLKLPASYEDDSISQLVHSFLNKETRISPLVSGYGDSRKWKDESRIDRTATLTPGGAGLDEFYHHDLVAMNWIGPAGSIQCKGYHPMRKKHPKTSEVLRPNHQCSLYYYVDSKIGCKKDYIPASNKMGSVPGILFRAMRDRVLGHSNPNFDHFPYKGEIKMIEEGDSGLSFSLSYTEVDDKDKTQKKTTKRKTLTCFAAGWSKKKIYYESLDQEQYFSCKIADATA